jgi:hypothetical protein
MERVPIIETRKIKTHHCHSTMSPPGKTERGRSICPSVDQIFGSAAYTGIIPFRFLSLDHSEMIRFNLQYDPKKRNVLPMWKAIDRGNASIRAFLSGREDDADLPSVPLL